MLRSFLTLVPPLLGFHKNKSSRLIFGLMHQSVMHSSKIGVFDSLVVPINHTTSTGSVFSRRAPSRDTQLRRVYGIVSVSGWLNAPSHILLPYAMVVKVQHRFLTEFLISVRPRVPARILDFVRPSQESSLDTFASVIVGEPRGVP